MHRFLEKVFGPITSIIKNIIAQILALLVRGCPQFPLHLRMRKTEIGMIALSMKVGNLETIQIKTYRDGTLTRIGAGGMPPIPIAAVSYNPQQTIFHRLFEKIPAALLVSDIHYADEEIHQKVRYELRFCGNPQNGWMGDKTIWGIERRISFEIDINTQFRSKVLAFADSLIKDAIGFSNDWYFDALVLAIFEKRSNQLPKQTMVIKPEGISDLRPEFGNFLSQMLHNPRKWNFMKFPEGKSYTDSEGKTQKLVFAINDGAFSYHFV